LTPHRTRRAHRVIASSALLVGLAANASVAYPAHAAPPARPPAGAATYKIGVSLPYTELPGIITGIERGVRVAIAQANRNRTVPGVMFQLDSLDDTVNGKHSGQKDATNARQFINDPSVIGEVGPSNSDATKVSEPVYNRAGLVQISPANTAVDLTARSRRALYEPASAISGAPLTYFRTCTTDAYQGPAAALYAKKAGFTKVYITDNKDTYGIGLAQAFKAEAGKIGLTIVGQGELDPNNLATSAQQLAASAARARPDLVYFGGEYGAKGGAEMLADSLRRAGLSTAAFMGGDSILAQDFINGTAAGGASHAYATTVGGDPARDPNAQAFLKAERALFPGTATQAYDAYAYDAANVLIDAFARAVKSGRITVGQAMTVARRQIIARDVAATRDFHGATGNFSFDANGDTTNHTISVYKVVRGMWTFLTVAPQPRE